MDHIVNSIEEAVSLASEWKANGKFSWFRGHRDHEWRLLSTMARIQSEEKKLERVFDQYKIFNAELEEMPVLRYLLEEEHVHKYFAVLQHNHVPTNYIDFTTEPEIAGFFASSSKEIRPGTQGCIICIDPDEMIKELRLFAEIQKWEHNWPEKVSVEVEGLSRMQAQSGNFIFLMGEGVENIYDYDRILFTHHERPYPIHKNSIYPVRRSALEIQLDRFFTKDLMVKNQERLKEMIKDIRSRGQQVYELNVYGVGKTKILRPDTDKHESWIEIDEAWKWVGHPYEDYFIVSQDVPKVFLKSSLLLTAQNNETYLKSVLSQLFIEEPDCRNKHVKWIIDVEEKTKPHEWVPFFERLWDGMRRLPFSNKQITAAYLSILRRMTNAGSSTSMTEINLVTANKVSSNAKIEPSKLFSAMRPDLLELQTEQKIMNEPRAVILALEPEYFFDFEKLVDVFAEEIIPSQVLTQAPKNAVFFAPTDITRLAIVKPEYQIKFSSSVKDR